MEENKTGNFIRELRKEKNLTQEQLSEILYIGREAVSKWERGVTIPEIDSLTNLSKFFDVSVDEILEGKRTEIDEEYLRIKRKNKIVSYLCLIILSLFFILTGWIIFIRFKTKSYEYSYKSDNFVIEDINISYDKGRTKLKINGIYSLKKEQIISISIYNDGKLIVKTDDLVINQETSEKLNYDNFIIEIETKCSKELVKLNKKGSKSPFFIF